MSKIYCQNQEIILQSSGLVAGSNAGIGDALSGSLYVRGFSKLTGLVALSASLAAASGMQILQSADGGVTWDILSACITLAAGASIFEYNLAGDGVKIVLTNGSSANTVRTLWMVRPI